jgi:dynein heavy chain
MIRLGRSTVPIDPEFRLYITTELPHPVFPSEVAVHANLINFTITKQGFEAQLLSVIVAEKLE